jgi:predicted Ser/Thr protein kinase
MGEDKKHEGQHTSPYEGKPPDDETTEEGIHSAFARRAAERFDLLQELGRGGMGIVFKARDREAGEIVALKILKPAISIRPELIERFKTELRLARKVTHKNVCRTYDLHRFGPVAAIAMEYVEGESLRDLLHRCETLSVRHGMKLMRQVLAGLREAHSQGVVHRDLKPENIVVARDGTVKVMDFGIARSVESGTTLTASGMVMGTPAYMSPEQAEGKPADVRSDIYALGLILYEMFTGRPAFEAETPMALAVKQLQEPPSAPRELEPLLPPHIEKAILKCLEKKPEKRFQSVQELEEALSQPVVKAPPVEVETLEAPLALHLVRWQRLDWLVLALALVGGFVFFWMYDRVYPYGAVAAAFSRDEAVQNARGILMKFRAEAQDYEYQADYQATQLLLFFPARVLSQPLDKAIDRLPSDWIWVSGGWRVVARPRGVREPAASVTFGADGRPFIVSLPVRREARTAGVDADQPPTLQQVLPLATQFAEGGLGVRLAGVEPREYAYDPSPARRGWIAREELKHARIRSAIGGQGPSVMPVEWVLPGEKPGMTRVVRVWARADGADWGMSYLVPDEEFTWVNTRPQEDRWEWAVLVGAGLFGLTVVLCLILFVRRGLYVRALPGLTGISLMGALAGVGVLWATWGEKSLLSDYGWLYAPLVFVLGWLLLYAVLGAPHYYAVRRLGTHLRTFVDLARERSRASAAGLSAVRGALLGICYAAVHTALLLVLGKFSLGAAFPHLGFIGFLGGASALWLVALTVLGAILGAWVLVAFPIALMQKAVHRAGLLVAVTVLWLLTAFSIPGAGGFPMFPLYLFAGLQGLFFAWIFLRYDLVACFAAMFTVATWLFCYPLYRVFGHVDFWPYSLVLAPWLLLVSVGSLIWLRPDLAAGWRRVTAAFE